MFAFFAFGVNPYITNLKHNGNAFYPFNDKDKYAILLANGPVAFRGNSAATKFFGSIFSEPKNDIHSSNIFWKNPFTLHADSIRVFAGTDVRVGGFGPLFSLLLILSIASVGLSFKSIEKQNKILLFTITGAIFFSVILTPLN